MSNDTLGKIGWFDLTVPDAGAVSEFYAQVAGWTPRAHAMDGYDDYEMLAADGQCAAGICHARGSNAKAPPQWLLYISVADVDAAAARAAALGGAVLDGPRDMGGGRFAVIRDPAGAVAALWQPSAGD